MSKWERGIEPPAAFFERPELWPQNQMYWDAFWDLGSERQIGMGIGPIPRSAIKAYADEYDMSVEEFDSLYRMLRIMDNEYLSLINEKKSENKGLVAKSDDPVAAHAVFEVIKARAAAANKKQVKRKTH